MVLSRLRYDERLAGWAGVERAMKREEVTRANCDAGRYTSGPVMDVRGGGVRDVMYASGRIALFCDNIVHLFDADTGARVSSFAVDGAVSRVADAVADRWVPFSARDGRMLLLDCVAAQLVEMAPADPERWFVMFTVSGLCVSYRTPLSKDVTIVHISGGPDGATVVREVTRVELMTSGGAFKLCERGHSYLLHDDHNHTLQLFVVATGQLERTFSTRACPPDCASL